MTHQSFNQGPVGVLILTNEYVVSPWLPFLLQEGMSCSQRSSHVSQCGLRPLSVCMSHPFDTGNLTWLHINIVVLVNLQWSGFQLTC